MGDLHKPNWNEKEVLRSDLVAGASYRVFCRVDPFFIRFESELTGKDTTQSGGVSLTFSNGVTLGVTPECGDEARFFRKFK